ncbi:dTDP-4-dehydrorhamnose 3,5-epimerase [Mucilaginibacter lacusdianchii]|uniref:dTDP-4-dehydrorhamnose 3,5-epimerase n=1 Tax=Mucilaginibacter lacusdianchii TaxID=2684211 RepID=UPI00131AF7F7|nr:dTDP-4-dehydrorhamnose 3,5-epimerase [Mucilaginibacter sp. JXJ CY 39]
MIFTETKLKGAFIIDVKRIEDERGFFGRSYCKNEFDEYGLNTNVVQTNVSFNKIRGTLRGMHMQTSPFGETKLVRCTRGGIYDVIVDLRPDSETFKEWIGVELTADSFRMLYVPEGFAHGFLTLEDNTAVTYQVTQFYTASAEQAYRWDDPAFNIEWPFEPALVSGKDQAHAPFEDQISA